jgi:SAM-dependent methyltransferase
MSEFSVTWLDLRESSDAKARNPRLLECVVAMLNSSDLSVVVDLGAGTGSILRALKNQGANVALWRLVDLNGGTLDEALRRHAGVENVEDHQSDLMLIDELPLLSATVVSASALFDLASEHFVDTLIARLKHQQSALYAPLNYDGTTRWLPAHPLDERVLEAFNIDQHTDKGMGAALGPESANYLAAVLKHNGYTVYQESSPWLLDSSDRPLLVELINGIAAAAVKVGAITQEEIDEWKTFRHSKLAETRCCVGHIDILAVPDNSPLGAIAAEALTN